MKIYNVIVEERHIDIEAYPFSDVKKAIKFAHKKAKELNPFSHEIKEQDISEYPENWKLVLEWGEGDYVTVIEYELMDLEKTNET